MNKNHWITAEFRGALEAFPLDCLGPVLGRTESGLFGLLPDWADPKGEAKSVRERVQTQTGKGGGAAQAMGATWGSGAGTERMRTRNERLAEGTMNS